MAEMNASFLKILILSQMKELELCEDFLFSQKLLLNFSLNQMGSFLNYVSMIWTNFDRPFFAISLHYSNAQKASSCP